MISANGTINGTVTPDRITRHRHDPTILINETALVAAMVFDLPSVAPMRGMLTRSMVTRTDYQAVVDLAMIDLDVAVSEERAPELTAAVLHDRLTDAQLKPHLSTYDAETLIARLGDAWDCDLRHRSDRTGYLRRIVNELCDVQHKARFSDEVQRLLRLYERGAQHDDLAAQVEHLHATEANRVAEKQAQTGGAVKLIELLESDPAEEPESVLRTGLAIIDRLYGGINLGDKWCISAKPGGSKTSLASQLTASIVETNPDLHAVVGLTEEAAKSWRNRLLVQTSGLALGVLRRPWEQLSPTQAESKRAAIDGLRAIGDRIHFLTAPLTPSKIEAAVVSTSARWVTIDFLQLMRFDQEAQTRRDNIDGCVAELVRISQQYQCSMLWISNLAKPAHAGRRDVLTAAKESGESTYRVRWRCLKNRRGKLTDIPTLFRGETMTHELADTGGVM